MDDLVERLSRGQHPIVASRAGSVEELRKSIDRGFVLVKFTDTRGGTELGLRLDGAASALDSADFDKAEGCVHLVGNLMLNYVKVRCVAELDLATLSGKGYLEVMES